MLEDTIITEIEVSNDVVTVKQESSAGAVLYDDYKYAGDITKTSLYDEGSDYSNTDEPGIIIEEE
jgi:hypothetical protein